MVSVEINEQHFTRTIPKKFAQVRPKSSISFVKKQAPEKVVRSRVIKRSLETKRLAQDY